MIQYTLQVKDAMESQQFKSAEVVAGENGLQKMFKWVHVVEIVQIENLLAGHELILTTGISLKESNQQFLVFVKSLIDSNCAGLCIEYGSYIRSIPKEVIALANTHDFPIIVFHEVVSFVSITQDLHSVIMNQQYLMISTLEAYSQQLNKGALSDQNIDGILKNMHNHLNSQIMLDIQGRETIFYPNMTHKKRQDFLKRLENEDEKNLKKRQPIFILDQHYADMTIFKENGVFTEFEMLIFDRTATALAQILMRAFYIEEKRDIEDAQTLSYWIDDKLKKEEIYKYVLSHHSNYENNGGTVFILSSPQGIHKSHEDIVYSKLYYRNLFERNGFVPFLFERKSYIVFILLNKQGSQTTRVYLNKIIKALKDSEFYVKQQKKGYQFAVGKIVSCISEISKSYQTALDTLYICRKVKTNSYFYDDLHLFHLIYKLQMQVNLKEVVNDYLQPIIDYDKQHNGRLMETLEVYLQTNGSKQETANQLFIVRQTLYHRLKKLETLLGKEFMSGHNRITLEFMLLANTLIEGSDEKNR
ncbi:PucR family transcriptional regulator [Rummeliibacillus sp. NPDC094406]|uniref:PucR family transcriptional regulator n=1 Tax=Rummeliibacillus sp. NPDC094406 TaxID=3364511 RepID=UPI0037F4B60E